MALDSRNKRASAIGVTLPWRSLLPAPDPEAETVGDRQQVGFMYASEDIAAPAPETGQGRRHRRGRMYGRNWRPSP